MLKSENKSVLFARLPAEPKINLLDEIRGYSQQQGLSVIVLDDDPTGTQTVYDIPVLTSWDYQSILSELKSGTSLFYILTNSRSLSEQAATDLALQIGQNIRQASENLLKKVIVISRGDSTLRGHYPAEVDALARGLGIPEALKILVPAFFEGGRYTINDIHYVEEDDQLIPASQTPFAQDKTFGYQNADLKAYVEEKTAGKVKKGSVVSFDLQEIRQNDPGRIREKFDHLPAGTTCVVNAAAYADLQIFSLALLKSKQPYVLRTAASIVPVLGGLAVKPLLKKEELKLHQKNGALIIVGSHVPKSTSQLHHLLQHQKGCQGLEFEVSKVMEDQADQYVSSLIIKVNRKLADNQDLVLFTSRQLVSKADKFASLALSKKVSESLVSIVENLEVSPRFIIAKGGITSSDIATKGLKVKKARVLGQIQAGVPVWELGPEARFPGLSYIIFPGNVGQADSISKIYQLCSST
ncbi:MAG: four-carbon acid sugar kinase family protein [Candidatus Cyclobacteriaceae bacterium M3_2C_046]